MDRKFVAAPDDDLDLSQGSGVSFSASRLMPIPWSSSARSFPDLPMPALDSLTPGPEFVVPEEVDLCLDETTACNSPCCCCRAQTPGLVDRHSLEIDQYRRETSAGSFFKFSAGRSSMKRLFAGLLLR